MFNLKECKNIKCEYTKRYDGKNIIIDILQYPIVYFIVTHGDGKSWGYFFNNNEQIFLGRSNQIIKYANFEIKQYSIFDYDYEFKLIGGNDAIKRTYLRLIQSRRNNIYFVNWCGTKDLIDAFKINPTLFANIVDCGVLSDGRYITDTFANLHKLKAYNKYFDYTKPLIKDACKMPAKWFRLLICNSASVDYINLLRKYNYPIEELQRYESSWYVTNIPEELIPNVEAGLKYVSDCVYRDYYEMRTGLSDETKRQFPTLPKDIKKYHDRIIPIYNREQAYRREEELKEKQKQYTTDFYKKAIEYNYSDDTYSIKACEKLVDLLIEGNSLHHCVGSYVNSVSNGKEYLLFLRKVSEPDVPYFTIDVTPDGQVRQIHGLRNCNMNEDIKPFVDKWAKKFNLNLEGCSGVKCALRWLKIKH